MNPAPPVTKILMKADTLPNSYVSIPTCVLPAQVDQHGHVFTAALDNEISRSLRTLVHRRLSVLDRHSKTGGNIGCLEINDAVPVAQRAQHALAFACLRDIVIESLSEFFSCCHQYSLLSCGYM